MAIPRKWSKGKSSDEGWAVVMGIYPEGKKGHHWGWGINSEVCSSPNYISQTFSCKWQKLNTNWPKKRVVGWAIVVDLLAQVTKMSRSGSLGWTHVFKFVHQLCDFLHLLDSGLIFHHLSDLTEGFLLFQCGQQKTQGCVSLSWIRSWAHRWTNHCGQGEDGRAYNRISRNTMIHPGRPGWGEERRREHHTWSTWTEEGKGNYPRKNRNALRSWQGNWCWAGRVQCMPCSSLPPSSLPKSLRLLGKQVGQGHSQGNSSK